jgi:hypothetical protein
VQSLLAQPLFALGHDGVEEESGLGRLVHSSS